MKNKLGLSLVLLFLAVPSFAAVKAGELAPDFALKNQDGKVVHLSDYKGSPVLLYFYPKDETPGCTKEACSFRDTFAQFKKEGVVILGISTQSQKSHQEFKAHHKLPFDLIADESGTLSDQYGVKKMPIVGLYKRESVLVSPDGKVSHVYEDVKPEAHAAEVLKDVEALKKK